MCILSEKVCAYYLRKYVGIIWDNMWVISWFDNYKLSNHLYYIFTKFFTVFEVFKVGLWLKMIKKYPSYSEVVAGNDKDNTALPHQSAADKEFHFTMTRFLSGNSSVVVVPPLAHWAMVFVYSEEVIFLHMFVTLVQMLVKILVTQDAFHHPVLFGLPVAVDELLECLEEWLPTEKTKIEWKTYSRVLKWLQETHLVKDWGILWGIIRIVLHS